MFESGSSSADLGEGGTSAEAAAGAALELIAAGLSALDAVPVWRVGDSGLRRIAMATRRLLAATDHAGLRWLSALDARPGAVPDAAADRAAATLLVGALNTAPAAANADAAAARLLHPNPEAPPGSAEAAVGPGCRSRSAPELSAAYRAGEVTRAHVDVVTSVMRRIPQRLLDAEDDAGGSGAAKVDAVMTALSRQVPPRSVGSAAQHLLGILDPDGSDRFDPDADRRRELWFKPDSTGMVVGRFQLDPVAGLAFTAINAYSAADPTTGGASATDATDATAGQSDGEPVQTRLPDTRWRGAAQCGCAGCDRAGGAEERASVAGDRPHILVSATPEQVAAAQATAAHAAAAQATAGRVNRADTPSGEPIGRSGDGCADERHGGPASVEEQTENSAFTSVPGWATSEGGHPVSPRTLASLLCDSVLVRVLRSPAGAALELGRSVRTATAAQRKALAARDGGCVAPGCTVPASGCEAHHVTWWSRGGATDVSQMALACPRHHANFHQGHWVIQMRSGLPWVVAPPWVDPERRPRRTTSHELAGAATTLAQQLLLAVEWGEDEPGDRRFDAA